MNKLFAVILLFPFSVFGQTDSLRSLQELQEGTKLADVYNQLSSAYLKVNLDSAFYFAEKGLKFSNSIDYAAGKAKALNRLASYYGYKEDSEKAVILVKEAIAIASEFSLTESEGESYLQLSDLYQNLNYSDSALFASRLSIQKFLDEEDSLQLSYAFNNLASIYYRIGDYTSALDNYLKSLTIKETLGDDYGIASTLANIALVYKNQGDFEKALLFNYKSIP